VVRSGAYLIIEGDTGTGKGSLAELIGLASQGSVARFQRLNLAGYPPDLAWGQVIGHTADAFTGATVGKLGAYCLAHKGTLFIDEFDQVEPTVQVLFLDITQRTRKHLRRVGATRELARELEDRGFIEKDLHLSKSGDIELREIIRGIKEAGRPMVRLIFGVSTGLCEKVERGVFRKDLYYRINVLRLSLPTIENRDADFAALVGSAVDDFDGEHKISGFCPRFYEDLCKRTWPGNIRQLRNVIQAAVTYAGDGIIRYSRWLEPALQGISCPEARPRRTQAEAAPSIRSLSKQAALAIIAKCLNETISDRHPRGNSLGASKLMVQRGLCRVSDTSIRKFVDTGEIRWDSGQYVLAQG
jgi:DNA-binding NtrC family response regulator